ncbi:DUF5682 family protein [Thermoflexus sp.]|uniref:DUF5682 family protein n=1 Tax=Thermoflexus sp. TaxID=1969742 RepID=UPI002ADE3B9E|nr:DUF5682 family protein [Thermoflexus sp.]
MDGILLLPVRHHSPAAARHTVHLIRRARPALVLIEGPADADPLIPLLADADTVPPVAILAYRQSQPNDPRVLYVLYPFCEYSPEWAALRTAIELGTPVRFCDVPARTVLAVQERDQPAEPGERIGPAKDADRLERSSEIWERLCRRMGYRSVEEWWEAVFEAPDYEPEGFVRLLLELGKTVISERQAIGGEDPWEDLRNAYMWHQLESAVRNGVDPRQIVLICGAAHAAVFAQALEDPPLASRLRHLASNFDHHPLLQAPPAELTLIPYSFPRLSEQLGYGAGNRAPQFYQLAHQWGSMKGAALETLTRLVGLMQAQGEMASLADAIEAYRLCLTLSAIRGKAQPGVDEVVDAAVATFGRGQAERVRSPLWLLMVGERVGRVPQRMTRTPLHIEFYATAQRLGLPLSDEPKEIRLNQSQPHEVQQSIFLHRLRVGQISFASYLQGEISAYETLSTVVEKWRLQWTPLTDISLMESIVLGNTLAEIAGYQIRKRLEHPEDVLKASEAALEAVLCHLPEWYETAMRAVEQASVSDNDFTDLARAVYNLSALIVYGASRSVRREVFQPLLSRLYTRACLVLPGAARCGDEEAQEISQAMRLLHEIAASLPESDLDLDLWLHALREVVDREGTHPLLVGLATALLHLARAIAEDDLNRLVSRQLSPGTEPISAARFLEGFFSLNRHLLIRSASVVRWLNDFVRSIPDDQFLSALPVMRRAFSDFSRSEIQHLVDTLLSVMGIERTSDAPRKAESSADEIIAWVDVEADRRIAWLDLL